MGKRPLAGAIGLLGVSIFLTGCNCCKQNNKQAFMNDRADSSLGVTKSMTSPGWNNKSQGSVATNSTPLSNLSGSPAGSPSGRGLDPAGGSSNLMGSGTSSSMGGAMTSSGIPPLSSNSSVPPTSMINPSGASSSIDNPAPTPSGPGHSSLTTGDIRTMSTLPNDSTRVQRADYPAPTHPVDGAVQHAAMGAEDGSHEVVPPAPPMTMLSSPPSSASKAIKSYPPTPPQAPDSPSSMMGADPAMTIPPPPVNAPTAPNIPGSGAKTSPVSTSSFPPGIN